MARCALWLGILLCAEASKHSVEESEDSLSRAATKSSSRVVRSERPTSGSRSFEVGAKGEFRVHSASVPAPEGSQLAVAGAVAEAEMQPSTLLELPPVAGMEASLEQIAAAQGVTQAELQPSTLLELPPVEATEDWAASQSAEETQEETPLAAEGALEKALEAVEAGAGATQAPVQPAALPAETEATGPAYSGQDVSALQTASVADAALAELAELEHEAGVASLDPQLLDAVEPRDAGVAPLTPELLAAVDPHAEAALHRHREVRPVAQHHPEAQPREGVELLDEVGAAGRRHSGQAHESQQQREEFIPGLGKIGGASISNLAYKGMDMMLGTTGIIDEDYPFACICNARGVCERDIMNTPCPHRAGQMAAAHRLASSAALFLPLLVGWYFGGV